MQPIFISAQNEPYIDVYTNVGHKVLLNFYVPNNSVAETNPFIIVYSNVYFQVFRNAEKVTNTTDRFIMEVSSQDKIDIYSNFYYYTFTITVASNESLVESDRQYPERFLDIAFNFGVGETLIGLFVLSPLLASYWRRRQL